MPETASRRGVPARSDDHRLVVAAGSLRSGHEWAKQHGREVGTYVVVTEDRHVLGLSGYAFTLSEFFPPIDWRLLRELQSAVAVGMAERMEVE